MIKFVIGFIALIFVALAVYIYTGENSEEISKSAVTHKTEVTKIKAEKPMEVAKEVSNSVKPIVKQKNIKNDTQVKYSSIDESQSEDNIGKGLTLESIENADVSDKEKERMLDDFIYRQSFKGSNKPSLSGEEISQMIADDLKNGL